MSRRSTGKDCVTFEIMPFLLIWLAGGSYLEIRLSAGKSQAAFYHYIYKCMEVLDSTLLAYKFPETEKELN